MIKIFISKFILASILLLNVNLSYSVTDTLRVGLGKPYTNLKAAHDAIPSSIGSTDYLIELYNNESPSDPIIWTKSGSSTNSITIKGIEHVTLSGSNLPLESPMGRVMILRLDNASYVTIDSITFADINGTKDKRIGLQLINDSQFNTIKNCKFISFTDTSEAAISIYGNSKNNTVTNCTFNIVGSGDKLHAVYLNLNADSNTIQNNTVKNCTGDAFRVRNGSDNNEFINNDIELCTGSAYYGEWHSPSESTSVGNEVIGGTCLGLSPNPCDNWEGTYIKLFRGEEDLYKFPNHEKDNPLKPFYTYSADTSNWKRHNNITVTYIDSVMGNDPARIMLSSPIFHRYLCPDPVTITGIEIDSIWQNVCTRRGTKSGVSELTLSDNSNKPREYTTRFTLRLFDGEILAQMKPVHWLVYENSVDNIYEVTGADQNIEFTITGTNANTLLILKDNSDTELSRCYNNEEIVYKLNNNEIYKLHVQNSGGTSYNFTAKPTSKMPSNPKIAVSQSSFSFSANEGDNDIIEESIIITNSGGSTLNWIAEENPPRSWLALTNTNGTSGDSVILSINLTGLTDGTYNSEIQISDQNAVNSPMNVPITLTVDPKPEISVNPSSLSFNATVGNSPSPQTLTITNSGGGTLAWSASEEPEQSWLNLTNISGSSGDQVTVQVDTTGLTPGTYNGTIRINDTNASNNPVDVAVTLTINEAIPDPVIAVNPTSLTFSATQNESNPPSQSVTVTNSGGGTLAWTAAESPDESWLTLSNTSGGDGDELTVSVDTTGISTGTHNGTIQISDANATNSPVDIDVTFTFNPSTSGGSDLFEFEAENGSGLPNAGWNILTNDGANCLEAEISDISSPPEDYRVDYTFNIPSGVSTVYVFAEVDVNNDGSDDSFWIKMNGSQQCNWNGLSSLGDGWNREWVFDYGSGNQYAFSVNEGTNTLSLYPRESGAFINWLVITTDGDTDIDNYTFSENPPPPTDPLISVSSGQLNFTAVEGNSPSAQTLTVTNSGDGTLSWTAQKVLEQAWLTISPTNGTGGTVMNVSISSSSLTVGSYLDTIRISDANAANSPLDVAVTLSITEDNPPSGDLPAEFEAELNSALPQSGWSQTTNDGFDCLLATESDITGPNESYRLDYYFNVPSGVSSVYVFAEVDVNGSNDDDSFWITMNDGQQCNWNNLYTLGDGWQRKWVYDLGNGSQNEFSVTEGQNKLSLYPREAGAFINWLVVTSDGGTDINNYVFDGGTPPASGPCLAVSSNTLDFSAEEGAAAPSSQSITVTNCGDSALSWSAVSLANQSWLEFSPASGTAGTQITVNLTSDTLVAGSYQDTIRISDPNAANSPQDVAVTLTITSPQSGSGSTVAEIEAESESSPPSEWLVTTNDNKSCLEALASYITAPEESQRIDYDFSVPSNVSQVYVFAEVDVNGDGGDDSFWLKMNGGDQCCWNGLYSLGDGWNREWVYDGNSTGGQYQFAVNSGAINTLSLYPRESGAFINWLVVTTDPDLNIDNYNFNGSPPTSDPVIAVDPGSVNFSATSGGDNPSDKYITVTNNGGGTLAWTASEQTNRTWLTLADTTGGSGDNVKLSVEIAGLTSDSTYNAVVVISAANATNSPVNVAVALTITDSSAAAITVTAPNGGESWTVGSTQQIQWTSTGISGDVTLDYSVNNGSIWNEIAASVSNSGNYNWQIPDNVSASCLVKIATVNDTTIYDVSDAVFAIESAAVTGDVWRVNCGGAQYTDGGSNIWSADQAYSSGSWGHNPTYTHEYDTENAISNTDDDPLYQSMRYGLSYYYFDIPNGSYQVTLHFAEIIQGVIRIFDVRIEGDLKLNDFNPYQEAGNQTCAAISRTFEVDVTDGQLNVQFNQVDGDPMISAIEVVGQSAMQQNGQIAATQADIVAITGKEISQNYPNPFNPETAIRFQIDEPGNVTLTIYNVLGEKIRTLVNSQLNSGQYTYTWNGCDAVGNKVSSGIYLYTLRIGNYCETKRMILMQ